MDFCVVGEEITCGVESSKIRSWYSGDTRILTIAGNAYWHLDC
jgi:hypothetical protein